MPRVSDILGSEGLIEPDGAMPSGHVTGDITREPMEFPLDRDTRLQALSRGDEGFLLALAYSTQRGYARSHPFVGEIRIGEVELELDVPELDFPVTLGRIRVTECQMVNQFKVRQRCRRSSRVAMGWCSARASARRWPCRCATGRCGRPNSARTSRRRAGRGVRHLAQRQRAGDRLRRAPEAAALCRLPGRTRPGAPHAGGTRCEVGAGRHARRRRNDRLPTRRRGPVTTISLPSTAKRGLQDWQLGRMVGIEDAPRLALGLAEPAREVRDFERPLALNALDDGELQRGRRIDRYRRQAPSVSPRPSGEEDPQPDSPATPGQAPRPRWSALPRWFRHR